MPRSPNILLEFPNAAITPADPASGGGAWLGAAAAAFSVTATAYPAANRALMFPFLVNAAFSFSTVGWLNGGTASGHVDVGVYDESLAKVVSCGSTVQAGTSAWQSASVAATVLSPDRYWLALACDNTSSLFQSAGTTATAMRVLMGIQQMAAAFPLPSAITLTNPASNYLPWFGIGPA